MLSNELPRGSIVLDVVVVAVIRKLNFIVRTVSSLHGLDKTVVDNNKRLDYRLEKSQGINVDFTVNTKP